MKPTNKNSAVKLHPYLWMLNRIKDAGWTVSASAADGYGCEVTLPKAMDSAGAIVIHLDESGALVRVAGCDKKLFTLAAVVAEKLFSWGRAELDVRVSIGWKLEGVKK